jgi:purine-binding chemotaxis protein CheW
MTAVSQMPKQVKYLTFILGEDEYAFAALKVEGILSLQPITPIPNTPHYFKGVTTVRGKVAPIISARLKLGMPEIEDTPETCIILITLAGDAWAGLIVDTVRDVVDINTSDVEPPPSMAGGGGNEVIGLAKHGERVKILLDVETLLANVVSYAQP